MPLGISQWIMLHLQGRHLIRWCIILRSLMISLLMFRNLIQTFVDHVSDSIQDMSTGSAFDHQGLLNKGMPANIAFEHGSVDGNRLTPTLRNVNPNVSHDMRIVGRLWADDTDEEIEVESSNNVSLSAPAEVVGDDKNFDSGYVKVLSKSQKKKLNKKNKRKNKARVRAGARNFS